MGQGWAVQLVMSAAVASVDQAMLLAHMQQQLACWDSYEEVVAACMSTSDMCFGVAGVAGVWDQC